MKVLIVGVGSIAKKHISALRKIDRGIDIYALRSSPNSVKIDGIKDIFDYSEIDKISPDFFILSNPTAKHYETIEKLMLYKLPLFIEKPVFSEVNNKNEQLINNIERDNIITYVACNLRFLECLKKTRQILKNKRINEINIYCGSYLPEWRKDTDYKKGYSANKEMGGGVHIDLIHEMDYVYWLFGKPNKTTSLFTNNSSLQITAYDYANYLWKYDHFSINIILNYYRRIPKREMEILTDKDVYNVNLLENSIYKNGEKVYQSDQPIIDTYEAQIRFFIDKVLHKKQKFNAIHEAYNVLKLCIEE